MSFRLFQTDIISSSSIQLPSSKSISNRLLIMQALSSKKFNLRNVSEAEDSRLMHSLLNSKDDILVADNAGTVFRFLTAFLAIQEGRTVTLTGSKRMMERPIEPLVKALQKLGADISYEGKEGFPPLKIRGTKLTKKKLKVDGSQSSQFVSALLLIAPYIEGGLKIEIQDPTSMPYIHMTLSLMKKAGIICEMDGLSIKVREGDYKLKNFKVEADWSSAAFFYQAFTLSPLSSLRIEGLKENSLQGDSICAELFESLGISSDFSSGGVVLGRLPYDAIPLTFDLKGQPDLILPFAIAASYILPSIKIKGIASLRHKESNRLQALRSELEKLADLNWEESENVLKLSINEVYKSIDCFELEVHDDHRIAMCLAPLVMKYHCLGIEDPKVVIKSFPDFWREISKMGIKLGESI